MSYTSMMHTLVLAAGETTKKKAASTSEAKKKTAETVKETAKKTSEDLSKAKKENSGSSDEKGFIRSIPDHFESFFASDSTFSNILQTVLLVIGCVVAISIMFLTLRYVLRWLHNKFRILTSGDMEFYEVIYEGPTSDPPHAIDLTNNIRNLAFEAPRGFKWYFSRPRVSIIYRNSEEDDLLHMYVGVSSKHCDERQLKIWASNMNCSLEDAYVEDIDIVTRGVVVGIKSTNEPANIEMDAKNSTIGRATKSIQEMMASGSGGTVMLTFEPMDIRESSLLNNHVTGRAQKVGGEQAILDQGPKRISILTANRPSRAVIAAFSDDGNDRASESLLKAALDSVPNFGWGVVIDNPSRIHRRASSLPSILLLLILILLSTIHAFPWWVTIVCSIFTLTTLFGLPVLSDMWIGMDAKRGAMAIPSFFRYSLRRMTEQFIVRMNPFDQDTGQLDRRYIMSPSTPEIIPLYQTSLMQLTTMPTGGTGQANIASTTIPQVAMPSNILKDIGPFIVNGDINYEGMSAKTYDPVIRTIDDVNFGVAMGGDAGSGKTNALMVDYVGVSRLSRKKSGAAGKSQINPIWFETKSDDIDALVTMVKPYNPRVLTIHDNTTPRRLCLEGPRLSDPGMTPKKIQENVNVLVDAFTAIWGESGMGPRSRLTAIAGLTIAMLLTEDEITTLFEGRVPHPDRPNVINLTNIIIGADPSLNIEEKIQVMSEEYGEIIKDPKRVGLRNLVKNMDKEEAKKEVRRRQVLQIALDQMVKLYKLGDATAPLQNKLPQLLVSGGLWDTYTDTDDTGEEPVLREEYSIHDFITYGGPVIVDMTPANSTISKAGTEMFTMMVHYLLWQHIQKVAGGWAAQKKFTPIYADEVSNFTGKSDSGASDACKDIIAQVRAQGRSYGVSHSIGFQNFNQMPTQVRSAVLSFPNIFFFRFKDQDDIDVIMRNLGENTRYTSDNIRMFPKGVGIAMMEINGNRLPPFTIKPPKAETWNKALRKAKGDVMEAYDLIRKSEISYMRKEKKKKIETTNVRTMNDDYDDSDNDGGYIAIRNPADYGSDSNEDAEEGLSWD